VKPNKRYVVLKNNLVVKGVQGKMIDKLCCNALLSTLVAREQIEFEGLSIHYVGNSIQDYDANVIAVNKAMMCH
jgi:hypothetical protein